MIKKLLVIALLSVSFMGTVVLVNPTKARAEVAAGCDGSSKFLGFPTWYKYLDVGEENGDPCAIQLPKDTEGNADWSRAAPRIGLAIIDILLRLATLAALGFVIYGGFRYITSQGEPDATASARQTILNAVIGLIIALLSSGIVAFVARTLTS